MSCRFPYQQSDPEAYDRFVFSYYKFRIEGFNQVFGLILATAVKDIEWPRPWKVDHDNRFVMLCDATTLAERNAQFASLVEHVHRGGKIRALSKLRGEMFPIMGPSGELLVSVDRAATSLFGTVVYGIQMLCYVKTDTGLKYWIPRRSKHRRSYPGMLDNCVGGGLATGEKPLEALIREAAEEASFPPDYVRAHAKPYGTLSYHMATDSNGEEGHQPQVQYVYELELTPDIVPRPGDDEVEKFELMTLDEVLSALAHGEFKTNCAITWIGYFVKNGVINSENEEHLYEICARIHRRLDFPTA